MAKRLAGAPVAPQAEDFSFVSPLVKYLLFFFNMVFWVSEPHACRSRVRVNGARSRVGRPGASG